MQNLTKEANLNITRIYSDFPQRRIPETVSGFGKISRTVGPVLIVSQDSFPHRAALEEAVEDQQARGRNLKVVYTHNGHRQGRNYHAGMMNLGMQAAQDGDFEFFTTVSSDLGEHLPRVLPKLLDQLQDDHHVLMAGVAVEGFHDIELRDQVVLQGKRVLHNGNFGGIFPSNTLAVHRLRPVASSGVLTVAERRFDELFEENLGYAKINGDIVPLRGHEDLVPPIKLLSEGKIVDLVLLAGTDYTIVRDSTAEVATHPLKRQTRPYVAVGYQHHYGVSDEVMEGYLNDNFHILTG